MRLHFLKSLFSLRKYQKEIKLSPLFIETTVSILAGLFMLIWGVIFFSNALYQFSLFTSVRNLFIPQRRIESSLSGIYCLGIDPKMKLVLRESGESYSTYDLIADGIEVISEYASDHVHRRIVIGIDYAFAASEGDGSLDRLIASIAAIPENLFIVFGGVLMREPETQSFLRPEFLDEIIWQANDRADDESFMDRLFMGGINYLKSSIRSGFEGVEDVKAAMGYIPVYNYGYVRYFSMPLCMYVVGEVMQENEGRGYDFRADFAMGQGELVAGSGIRDRIKSGTGRSIRELAGLYYYNFFTSRDISDFLQHYLWLSNHSARIDEFNPSIEQYFNLNIGERLKQQGRERTPIRGNVEYFFIAPVITPEFLLDEGEENDEIITLASGRNAFTYEVETVSGVMAHITALSNLRNHFFTNPAPWWTAVILYALMIGGVFLITWTNDLFRSLLLSVLVVFAVIATAFVLFLLGQFVSLRTPLAVSVLIFALVAIARFMFTTKRQELYAMIASRVFSPSQMRKLMASEDTDSWQREKIIHDGVIMVLLPKRLPSLGDTDEEAGAYTKIYERYLALVFEAIEKYGGSHDVLSMDGVLGFWNVPVWEDGNEEKAFLCARECLALVSKWQEYIDEQYRNVDERYTAAFDVSLNRCSFYAGCLGTGEIQNYALSGEEVNFTISATQAQIKDEESTIQLTERFMEILMKSPEWSEDRFKLVYYDYYEQRRRLYHWNDAE